MATIERKRPTPSPARSTQAMELRIAGHTQQAVADRLGITQQRVSMIEREWLAAREPSTEVTEARRQQQLAGIDATRARLFAALDSEVELGARLAVVDRIEKLWNREARLVGLDLERNVSIGVSFTAEAMAELFGWAPTDVVDVVGAVEVPAVEITDGGDA